jgi:hypothetical protein
MAAPPTPVPEFTYADLLTIDAAIKSGASEVRFQDRTVRYRSTADMLIARNLIWNYLNPGKVVRQQRISTRQGFGGGGCGQGWPYGY